jgi:hypothetical protein
MESQRKDGRATDPIVDPKSIIGGVPQRLLILYLGLSLVNIFRLGRHRGL